MQTNEAKKKLIDITTNTDISKYTTIKSAKKRLLETDPGIDISEVLFFCNQGEFSKAKSELFTQLISKNMIDFLSEPLLRRTKDTLAAKITDFALKTSR